MGLALPAQESAASAPQFRPYERAVITWVPPYKTRECASRLQQPPAGLDPAAALTHVALQFWVPSAAGGLERARRYDALSDDLVSQWRDWAHGRGVRVLLCVYNGETKWDWPLAHRAFAEQPERFVAEIIVEVERMELDGVDMDLEGNGNFESDKAAYLAFLTQLSAQLRARGKQLFVDTFAYIWNAPNQRWWAELFPMVDGVNSMGYEETGARSPEWRGFAAQAKAAGENAHKLNLGLPTHLEKWQSNSLLEHLSWFGSAKPGVALWDAQFLAPTWQTPDPWTKLRALRPAAEGTKPSAQ